MRRPHRGSTRTATRFPATTLCRSQLPGAMPIVGRGGADDEPPLEFEGDLPAMLYDAARRCRVDRALELLDAGADPAALPADDERDQRSLPVLAAVLPDLDRKSTRLNSSH